MIYLGSDHAGFFLKEEVKQYLKGRGIRFQDVGNEQYDPADDYPDFAVKVAERVSGTKHRGILFCGSAIGMVIAANKVHGVRAAHVFSSYTAQQSKAHDNVNVLVLAGRITKTREAKRLIGIWLNTKFSSERKYRRRVQKLQRFEENMGSHGTL